MRYDRYDTIVAELLQELELTPIDLLRTGDAEGEKAYLVYLRSTYARTIRDIDALCTHGKTGKRVLEIGSLFGVVSIALKRLGYTVSALDIPEFYESEPLRARYERNGIPFVGLNLRGKALPYESDSFDIAVACEVLEHLNFNPLPVLVELNRILRPDGYAYIGLPNQAKVANRLKLLLGQSIHNPVADFVRQLSRDCNGIVSIHWREYTLAESVQLVETTGFRTVRTYHFAGTGRGTRNIVKRAVLEVSYLVPSLRPFNVVIAQKQCAPKLQFFVTEANS